MKEENLQRLQYRVLERLQYEIKFALKHEPGDYGENNPKYEIEEDVWKELNLLNDELEELLEDYKKRERKFIAGEYYLDESNGRYLKCEKRTNNSVWFNGARLNIVHYSSGECTRGTWNIFA